MKTVHEVSRETGVSIRALHHYDAIGLLKPAKVTEAGYRLYDEKALCRLQTILMYRELGFALADIAKMLDSPQFDRDSALDGHIEMLKMQRAHIDRLLEEAEKMKKGKNADFAAFDRSDMDKYAEEVKARWGNTAAYKESEEKCKSRQESEATGLAKDFMQRFAEIGELKRFSPASAEAQAAVRGLQDYISANYYTCTKEILAGLGEMYVADGRFRENIDAAGGEGTADFIAQAIRIYCK